MRQLSHLNTASSIISKYDGKEPLAAFLKKFFAADKKYGSGDRRNISAMCYSYYRPGKAHIADDHQERILKALFLCNDKPHPVLEALRPGWNKVMDMPVKDKWHHCGIADPVTNIFPWKDALSENIDHEAFCLSMLIQPDLFLRIRPGRAEAAIKKLKVAAIAYEMTGENTIALPNATKLEGILEADRDVVIQDRNSQKVLDRLAMIPAKKISSVWDCCAASGGKSILCTDSLAEPFSLTVSDIRQSILANLARRFETAGIKKYRSFIADLSQPVTNAGGPYDLIICDAPCSGSGTWSRTPEQLYFFEETALKGFHSLQQKIVSNALPLLAPDGIFIYITCSVFREENEDIVKTIGQQAGFVPAGQAVLPGYTDKADSMYTAVFHKKS